MAISPQQLTIYLYNAHRAVIFAIAQLSCSMIPPSDGQTDGRAIAYTRYSITFSKLLRKGLRRFLILWKS